MPILGASSSGAKPAPTVPTSVSASNSGSGRAFNNGAASVSFTAPATSKLPITSYTVTSSPGSFTASGASSPLTVTGLQSNTAYTYTVTATSAAGTSSASSASSSVTATTVPQAPTIGTPTAGADTTTQVSVPFTSNATGGSSITSYTVTSSPGNVTGTGASSPVTVSGLSSSTAYTFTVTATNANGTSAASSSSSSITTAAPTSFESIATLTPGGSASTVTFSSIPQTYKTLQVRISSATGGGINVTWNGLTSNNYQSHLRGFNNGSENSAQQTWGPVSVGLYYNVWYQPNNQNPSTGFIDIPNYTSTTTPKVLYTMNGYTRTSGQAAVEFTAGTNANTSAITSLSFQAITSWGTGTTIALYGTK